MNVDLHIHSECSDGSDSVAELAKKIEAANISIAALTDHDTVAGIKELKQELSGNIKLINGIELTCLAGNIKCHILGYFIDPDNQELTALIQKGKQLRLKKLETRIKYLKDVWNIELTEAEKSWLYSRHSVVKTHLANIIVERGLSDDNVAAMKKYLDGCKTGNTRFDADEAIETIKKAGGIPVWAHPLGGEGEEHTPKDVFASKLQEMLKFGIQGLECFYSRYSKEESEYLENAAKLNGLYISGGSDYHGSNKDGITLCKLNDNDVKIPSEKLTVLSKL